MFLMDGKMRRMAWPGRGQAATMLVARAGGDDVNLVQRAFYHGHH